MGSTAMDESADTAAPRGSEERRERVIQAAMLLANEGGYEAVQMRTVAERAGVALGTIYRYFSGKDDLLVAGLSEWIRLVRHRIERRSMPEDPAERLVAVVTAASDSTDRAPVLMAATITALAATAPSTTDYRTDVEAQVAALIDHAIGGAPGVDVEGVRRVIGHVWFSALTRWVGGMAPDGSVGEELRLASRLLLGTAAPDDDAQPSADNRSSKASAARGSEK